MFVYGGKVLVLSALARAMTKTGYQVHVSHVSRVLRGERAATKDFVVAVARVLGMTLKEAQKFVDDAQTAAARFNEMPQLIKE